MATVTVNVNIILNENYDKYRSEIFAHAISVYALACSKYNFTKEEINIYHTRCELLLPFININILDNCTYAPLKEILRTKVYNTNNTLQFYNTIRFPNFTYNSLIQNLVDKKLPFYRHFYFVHEIYSLLEKFFTPILDCDVTALKMYTMFVTADVLKYDI